MNVLEHKETAVSLRLCGVGASPGIVVGVAHVYAPEVVHTPERRIRRSEIAAETRRFRRAVNVAQNQIAALRAKVKDAPVGQDLELMLDPYVRILENSRLIRGVENRIRTKRVNVEAALQREVEQLIAVFSNMDDPYLAGRRDDIRAIGQRLARNLTGTGTRVGISAHLPRNAVVIAHELAPADAAFLGTAKAAGFVTERGGTDSHTAIMARSLACPAVLSAHDVLTSARNGDTAVIDGTTGHVILNPDAQELARYRKLRADYLRRRRTLARLRDVAVITTDGTAINLAANIELPSELSAVLDCGAAGVGLFRSEFLFMNRADWPSEDEQYEVFSTMVKGMNGRPITIRTLDANGDKLDTTLGGVMPLNPALGLRAVRFLLSAPEILEAHLSAILRASAHGPIRILLPMVSVNEEITAIRGVLKTLRARLIEKGVPVAEHPPPLGPMIEIPAAALAADVLARSSDFFALGTNDLTQYALAIDRNDDAVAHLYNPLHPSVLRLIHFATAAARRANIPISVCGEIAGDEHFSPLLIGLGIRELSMSTNRLPHIKRRVRSFSVAEAEKHATAVMSQCEPDMIKQLVAQFASRKPADRKRN